MDKTDAYDYVAHDSPDFQDDDDASSEEYEYPIWALDYWAAIVEGGDTFTEKNDFLQPVGLPHNIPADAPIDAYINMMMPNDMWHYLVACTNSHFDHWQQHIL